MKTFGSLLVLSLATAGSNAFVVPKHSFSTKQGSGLRAIEERDIKSLDLRAAGAILALVVSTPFIGAADVEAAGYDMATDMTVLSADKVEAEEKAAEAAVAKINAEEEAAAEKKAAEEKAFKEKIAKSEVC